MTAAQREGPSLGPVEFAEWFVDEIMPEMHPIPRRELTRVSCLRMTKSAHAYLVHFGFERTSHKGQVMSLMWMLAPNFFAFRPFSDILADPNLTPGQKVDALWAVDDAAMQRAENGCDDRAWYPRLVPGNILGLKAYDQMTR